MELLHEIGEYPMLTAEEEVALFQALERGEASARERLVTSNLRLVVWVAKRYQRSGIPLADLVQEGTLGLMRAIDGFEWRRGFKFSTYATWWVRQRVLRAVREGSQTIRLPESVTDDERELRRTVEELTARLGREPTEGELLEAVDIDAVSLARLHHAGRVVASLDTPVDIEGSALGDLVAVDDATEEQIDSDMRADAVRSLLEHVPARARQVLVLRYGLDGDEPRTLGEVGDALGLSRERVRQIEQRALHELARRADSQGLRLAS